MGEQGSQTSGHDPHGAGTDQVWEDISRVLVERGPAFLASRRWFGDKARRIVAIDPLDHVTVAAGLDLFVPVIAGVRFADGDDERYFVPLVITEAPVADHVSLGQVTVDGRPCQVAEAIAVESFRGWLLDLLVLPDPLTMRHGTLTFTPTSVLDAYISAARTGPSRVVTGEQSNSSIVYGDAAILKAFRKLQRGTNPDIEIGRYLTDDTGFSHAPPLLGAIEYTADGGDLTSIAVLQLFVPSRGDAWTSLLNDLRHLLATVGPERDEMMLRLEGEAALLGRRTGELHVALAGAPSGHAMAPETITVEDAGAWASTLTRETSMFWSDQGTVTTSAADDPANQRPDPALTAAASGYADLVGFAKTRVHGDYHLGQILHTLTGDVMILDFEGEPSRPVEERRRKTSPLKDVAGMLRSFTYARVAILRASATRPGPDAGAESTLGTWEAASRRAFLTAYRTATQSSPVPLYPNGQSAFDRALRAWEVEKAIYEVRYERNNRPDWLPHVLATLDRLTVADDPPED